MDSPDRRGAIDGIVKILRKATRTVQVLPFVYLCFYGVYMIGGVFLPDGVVCFADSVLFASPVLTGFMLGLSRLFRLCRWHKAACLIPSSSSVEGYIDGYVFQFTQGETALINSALGALAILFLFLAIKHFFHAR